MVYAKLCILHNFMVRNTVDIVHDDQMNTLSMSQFQLTILLYITITALYMKPR